MSPGSTDLRQLALLLALVDAQSLSLAAERVGLTPSAASQSLQRLRESFGDDLVVRQGANYMPTPVGLTALEAFREMVHIWQNATSGGTFFDPASTDAHFCIACIEGLSEIDLDACYAAIVTRAPRMRIDVREPDLESGGYDGLHAATTDVLLTNVPPSAGARDLHAVVLPNEDLSLCCLSASHPRIGDTLSLAQYLAEQHLLAAPVPPPESGQGSLIDQWLLSAGHPPRVSSVVRPVSRLAVVLSTTDRLSTVSRLDGAVLRRYADNLRLMPLPPELPRLKRPRFMVWHHRTHNNPPHRWLRERLRDYIVMGEGAAKQAPD